jgi:hypothetical protein
LPGKSGEHQLRNQKLFKGHWNGPTPEFWHEAVRLALTCGRTRREIAEASCILFPQPRLHKRSKINTRDASIRSTFDKKRIEAETASLRLVFDARHTLDLPDEHQGALETDRSTLMV